MGFINSKGYAKNRQGVVGYTGMYNSDTDWVEFFPLTGKNAGKREIVDIFDLEVIKCPAEIKVIEVLYKNQKRGNNE